MTILLILAALGQIAVALLNFRLDTLLGWQGRLAALPPLMREVFHVHKWFISITLLIFAAITLRFAPVFAGGGSEVGRWLCGGIGLFWAIRTGIQWLYYDRSHWRGQPGPTAVHWALTLAYGGCGVLYLAAALR